MILFSNRHVSYFEEYLIMLKLSGAIGNFIKLASISIKCTVICKSLNRPLIIKTISVLLCIFVVVVALCMCIICFDIMVKTLNESGIEMAMISVLGGLIGASFVEFIVGFIPDPRKQPFDSGY